MKFITIDELKILEEREDVNVIDFNGISGIDGKSKWYTIYYTNNNEEDIYIK